MEVILDSGAYTAYTTGRTITLNGYTQWLRQLSFTPWRYFTLDVYSNAEQTKANYNAMIAEGFTPIPVFTTGETLDVFNEYAKTSDVVAVGGLGNAKNRDGYLRWISNHCGSTNLHMLGVTKTSTISALAPYMCDSSSWLSAPRYGTVHIYVGNGKFVLVKRSTIKTLFDNSAVQSAFDRLGIPFKALFDKSAWLGTRSLSTDITTRSWLLFARDLRKVKRTRLFLAFTTRQYLATLVENYGWLCENVSGFKAT